MSSSYSYSYSSSYEEQQQQEEQQHSSSSSSHHNNNNNSNEESETTQLFFVCFSAILVVILFLSRILDGYKFARKYLSEPAMTLLVGITCSWLIREFYHVQEEDLDVMDAQHYEDDDLVAGGGGDDAYIDNNNQQQQQYYAGDDDYNYNIKYYSYNDDDDDDDGVAGGDSSSSSASSSSSSSELPSFFLYFPSKVFFLALLPPILFNSGYQLQRELFYRHFLPIALFAIVGTFLSAFGAGGLLVLVHKLGWMGSGGGGSSASFQPTVMELITFGSLIAATDTVSVVGVLQRKRVDPHLFSLVFGESALNDAVAIVLFKTAADFLRRNAQGEHDDDSVGMLFGSYLLDLVTQAVVSPVLGIVFAGIMGYAFKVMDFREHRMLEMSLYILPVYIPFIVSELLDLSGMITIFFTGIFARRYMEPNVSPATKEYSLALFQLLSFLAETCIFLELGLSVFGLHKSFYFPFIGWAFVAALLGRALSVYPISAVYNFSLTKPVPNVNCAGADGTAVNCAAAAVTECGKAESPTRTSLFVAMDDNDIVASIDDYPQTSAATTGAAASSSAGTDIEQQEARSKSPKSFLNLFKKGKAKLVSSTPSSIEDNYDDNENVDDTADNHHKDPLKASGVFVPAPTGNSDDGGDGNQTPDENSVTSSKVGEDQGSVATNSTATSLISRRETPVHRRDKIIPTSFQHVLWFAGLRGAVAYACAREFPDVYGHRDEFIAATMVIVLITIVLMGGLVEDFMTWLGIRMNVNEAEYMRTWHRQRKLKGRFLHFEYNFIYRYVVRDENVRFMDESCGYMEHVGHDACDYRVGGDVFSSKAYSPHIGGGGGGGVRRRRFRGGETALMAMSNTGNVVGSSTRTAIASGNNHTNSKGGVGDFSVVTLNDGLMNPNIHSVSHYEVSSSTGGYVAPSMMSSTIATAPGGVAVMGANSFLMDNSLMDHTEEDHHPGHTDAPPAQQQQQQPATITTTTTDPHRQDRQRRHPLISYSEDLSEDGRNQIDMKLTPVLSNQSDFFDQSTDPTGNAGCGEPRQRLAVAGSNNSPTALRLESFGERQQQQDGAHNYDYVPPADTTTTTTAEGGGAVDVPTTSNNDMATRNTDTNNGITSEKFHREEVNN
eukprot:CAMPEP_0113474132 /NCGR_PEP_ID=MMETSP0014_2-20120614/18418_1 /TAXON_ID=2857 /ORGANISM="Nitzschia sp." /LENGTH=1116 /DNA_ID=CAMNT_0000366953 /DNA_START=449 /DNA_END=3799 /DNA_ORIENTATION=- /assembly_acc=CAM_ASM_000159